MDKRFFETYYLDVYKYILYLTNDTDLAHDFLQETFFRFYKNNDTNLANPKAFLMKIARNIIYDHFRKKRILQFITMKSDERVDEAPLPEEVLMKGEEASTLYKALQKIKFEYKEAVVLRYIEDYSVKETAIILNCSEAKVKNNTARGLKKLRELLEGGEANARGTIERNELDSGK